MSSEMRIPNSSSITTTSPRAINVPLTSTSTGAPAARSRSMTAPGVIDSNSRTVMRQRPSSAVTPISTSASTYDAPDAFAGADAGWVASWFGVDDAPDEWAPDPEPTRSTRHPNTSVPSRSGYTASSPESPSSTIDSGSVS